MLEKKELTFVVFILYVLGQHWNMTTPEVYDILNSTGILDDYIIKCKRQIGHILKNPI